MEESKVKIIIISIIAFVILSILFVVGYISNNNLEKEKSKSSNKEEKITSTKKEKKEEVKKMLFVDVKGAINNPGVYLLEEGLRVNDAINASGGITEDADTSILNLSKKLEDEMVIIVYTTFELAEYKKQLLELDEINKKLEEDIICPDSSNGACIRSNKTEENENTSLENETKDEKISINTATKEELMKINGIGEGKAEAIIKYREENGPFKSLEDIKNVSGIGDSIYEKIKDHIKL